MAVSRADRSVAGAGVGVAGAQATLIGRLEANTGLMDYQAYYDDDLNITWAANANINGLMTWSAANAWAAGLTIGGFSDWRLPTTTQPDASCSNQNTFGGSVLQGFGAGCTGSEMGHLFNVESITAADPGVFNNVHPLFYLSGTEFAFSAGGAWNFNFIDFGGGSQNADFKGLNRLAWAVHSGDVSAPAAVPEPSTMLLMGSGLVCLLAWRCCRRG